MKTTKFRKLLAAAVSLFTAVSAQAQFTASVEQTPRSDWAPVPATFPIADVATALGTDGTTLLAALDTWIGTEAADPNMFFYAAPSAPDTWSDAYTTGGEKGFWLDENAEIISYPNGAYYTNPVWSADEATFSINIGMMPDALKYGTYEKQLKFALQYNGLTATFTIDFTVKGADKVDIPEPATLKEAELNIVGEKSITVEQYPRSEYTSDLVEMNLDDIVEKLGIPSGKVLSDYLGELLYCTVFDLETVGKKDSISNQSTAGAPGFWLTDIREDGVATGECSAHSYNGGDKFFIERFAFNAENDTLSCYLGQYPGNLEGGDKFFANLYIVYGDKAYRLRYYFNVIAKEQGNGLDDYTRVGAFTDEVELEPSSNAYTYKVVHPDIEGITAALGGEIEDMLAIDLNNDFSVKTAENETGYWFEEEGFAVSWSASSSKLAVFPDVAGDYSALRVCQYPGKLNVGDEAIANLYFVSGGNYVAYTVRLKMVAPKEVNDGFQSVAQRTYQVQQTPGEYVWTEGIEIPAEWVEQNIGTSDWVVYGLNVLNEDGTEKEGNDKYTKNYTCTPYPGFWMDENGRNIGWREGAHVGFTATTFAPGGAFSLMQYAGGRQVGDIYHIPIFLVNEENGKMVTFNFVYSIVDEIVTFDVVGSENITLPISQDEYDVPFDMAKAAEALGTTVDELLDETNACLRAMGESGTYGTAQACADGVQFNKFGNFDQVDVLVSLFFQKKGDAVLLTTYAEEEVADEFSLGTQFCLQKDNKIYEFVVKFVSMKAYEAGIADITAASNNPQKVYDLSGRQVVRPVRGLYITNGKKHIVK